MPATATSSGPCHVVRASAYAARGSCQGGMWVRTRRPTPAPVAVLPQSEPVMCRSGGLVASSRKEASHKKTSAPAAKAASSSQGPVSPL
jgi:hypothetical protein